MERRRAAATAKRKRNSYNLAAPLTLCLLQRARGGDCPPMLNGWVPSPGCKQYYLCEAGEKASPNYDCRDGFLFDVSTTNCQQESGVTCKSLAGESSVAAGNDNQQPPPSDGSCGGLPEIFFVDTPTQTCLSNCQKTKPDWIQEIFPTREECCQQNFQWGVDACLGKEFVEEEDAPKLWWTPPGENGDASTPKPLAHTGSPTPRPLSDSETSQPVGSPTKPPIEVTRQMPEWLFMCGFDWGDASARCHQRCASGEDEECPEGEGCFSQTSCVDGVKGTAAPVSRRPTPQPTPKPTRRTRPPMTASPSLSPVTRSPSVSPTTANPATPNPTNHPSTAYITHQPILAPSKSPSIISEMSAVASITVVDLESNESGLGLSIQSDLPATRRPRPDAARSRNPTKSPVVAYTTHEPTGLHTAEPSSFPTTTAEPTTPAPIEFPTFAPSLEPTPVPSLSPVSQRPNFVVTMIAGPPSTVPMETMSESVEETVYDSSLFGMVPILGSNQNVQGSQGSLGFLSLYSSDYTQTVPVETESPSRPSAESFFESSTAASSELIIPVSADATVSPKRPDLNFGSNTMLALDGPDAFEQFDILLKFDVSVVDQSSDIKSATLKIFATDECPFGGSYYSTTSFNLDWDTSTVTWKTAPRSLALLDSLDSISSDSWYDVDVKALFDLKVSTYVTIRVESSTDGRCMFASKENLSNKAPYLVVETQEKRPQSEIVGMSGSINNNPPVKLDLLPIGTGEFDMVRASADATIDAFKVNAKLGTMPSLHISVSSSPRQVLESVIYFDLRQFQQQLPQSAMLVLFPEIDCASAGRVSVTRMTGAWSETEVNWTNAPGTEFEVGTFDAIEAGHWYGFNVVKALERAHSLRSDSITFRLSSVGDDSCQYSSIQSGRAPKLVASF